MKHLHKKSLRSILIVCFLLPIFAGCNKTTEPTILQSTDVVMGTIVSQTIYLQTSAEKTTEEEADLTDEIMEILDSLEKNLLSWRISDSEINKVNQHAGNKNGTRITEELYQILERTLRVTAKSNGALDITIGQVINLWDIDTWSVETQESTAEYQIPDQKEIATALSKSGYEKVTLRDSSINLPEGMILNLGAIGKGYACETAAARLAKQDSVTGAVISIGGSVATYGSKPDASAWTIGIVNPFEPTSYVGYLTLSGDWYISTSGDYERYIEVAGVQYHHILDPENGYPADSGLSGVTILCRDGLLSDALSTACFILGAEEGLKLAESFEAEALMIDREGNIYQTEGMRAYFSPLE